MIGGACQIPILRIRDLASRQIAAFLASASSAHHEIAVHRQPGRLALLRMELAGRQVLVLNDRREWIGIVGFCGDMLALFRNRVVRVDEIDRKVRTKTRQQGHRPQHP